MTLGDLENLFLLSMQEQGPTPSSAPPLPGPNFAALNNPPFSQSVADFYLNLGLNYFYSDLSDTEIIFIQSTAFASTASTFQYGIPPKIGGIQPNAPYQVNRVFYQPTGFTYTFEFEPGIDFISWEKFQEFTSQGYLQTTSAFSTIPFKCAVTPNRSHIQFYPGSANAGDLISLYYVPSPTVGIAAVNGGTLVDQVVDSPLGPTDSHIAVAYKALELAWVKARELETSKYYGMLYKREIDRIIKNDMKTSRGDTYGFKTYNWRDRAGINSPVIRILG